MKPRKNFNRSLSSSFISLPPIKTVKDFNSHLHGFTQRKRKKANEGRDGKTERF